MVFPSILRPPDIYTQENPRVAGVNMFRWSNGGHDKNESFQVVIMRQKKSLVAMQLKKVAVMAFANAPCERSFYEELLLQLVDVTELVTDTVGVESRFGGRTHRWTVGTVFPARLCLHC